MTKVKGWLSASVKSGSLLVKCDTTVYVPAFVGAVDDPVPLAVLPT